MVVIVSDNKIRNVKLTGDEIILIIEELQRMPYDVYRDFHYDDLVKKLKEVRDKTKVVKRGK